MSIQLGVALGGGRGGRTEEASRRRQHRQPLNQLNASGLERFPSWPLAVWFSELTWPSEGLGKAASDQPLNMLTSEERVGTPMAIGPAMAAPGQGEVHSTEEGHWMGALLA
jgi:hypothetical protein